MLLLEASEIFKSADILILFPYLHVEKKMFSTYNWLPSVPTSLTKLPT